MDIFGELAVSLGIGDIPILNAENKRLSDNLVSQQIGCEKLRGKNQEEDESINRIFGHVQNIKEAYNATKHLVNATREQEETEVDLKLIAESSAIRNKKEVHKYQTEINDFLEKNEELQEDVAARDTINQLLDDEHESDITTLMKWTSDVDQYEEDIFSLLKFKHQDQIRIKEHHLRLERAREQVANSKNTLDSSSTESRMAQLALDKTAEAFRQLHIERLTAMNKWQEALGLIDVRETELQESYEKVSIIKANVMNMEMELKEQVAFMENEKGNVTELQHLIVAEELKARRLDETLEATEAELRDFESEITLEKRQMWKVGSEIDSKKIRMHETRREFKRKTKLMDKLTNEVNILKTQKISCNNKALTAEERASQMQRLLDHEQLQYDMTQVELHKSKERMLSKQHELKDLDDEEGVNAIRVQGLWLEQRNIEKQVKTKKADLIRREDVAVANDQKLVSIEREIARIKGTIALDNRAQLKSVLESLKIDHEGRQADKRNLDHLVHKMMCEVKKVGKDVETIDKNQTSMTAKLEEVLLVNETCDREHKQMFEKVEAFLLEDKMLKLTEQRTKQELEQLNQELLELRKEDLEVNEQLREQRTDMESKRELYTAQSRCLKDEISTIRCEIRDRKDKVEKLKIRYDTSVKALGDIDQKKSSMPSHALHMVKVAQEKAELSEQSEVLAVKIEKEEEELESLEKAMALMKHSNDRYRVSNCRNADVNTDQTLELEEAMKQKVALVKQLKRRLVEVGNDIKQVEYLVEKCSGEVDRMKSLYDSRYSEAMQLDKELKDQERKLGRARHAVNTLCHDMKDLMPNPESFEHDMDLREEKEKQRSALLQIRELSNTDTTFNYRVQEDLGRLGLCIPPISRMEARATSSRTSRLTASTRIATAGSSRSGFYRQDGGHVSDSVVVMELDVGGGSSDQGRSKTAMTVG